MSADGRIRVGVLMGGASAEREISLASGKMIAEHLPRDRYDVVMLDTLALMARHPALSPGLRERAAALVAHHAGERGELQAQGDDLPGAFQEQIRDAATAVIPATEALVASNDEARIDVAFIALHGRYGEDGTIQGMLDLLGIPYVGSGTLASALAMDKAMAKKLFAAEGIPTPAGVTLERADFAADPDVVCGRAAAFVPAVVKPVSEGSSIGMSLVNDVSTMPDALRKGFACDARVLVEERVAGTELTVGVVGNRELTALPVIEIVPKRAFFDYKAKYDPALSDEICPARVPGDAAREAQDLARRAHRALGCRGLSRTDMILSEHGLVVLELNTLPGMTVNSLLPKAARTAGIPFGELLHRLIRLALED